MKFLVIFSLFVSYMSFANEACPERPEIEQFIFDNIQKELAKNTSLRVVDYSEDKKVLITNPPQPVGYGIYKAVTSLAHLVADHQVKARWSKLRVKGEDGKEYLVKTIYRSHAYNLKKEPKLTNEERNSPRAFFEKNFSYLDYDESLNVSLFVDGHDICLLSTIELMVDLDPVIRPQFPQKETEEK